MRQLVALWIVTGLLVAPATAFGQTDGTTDDEQKVEKMNFKLPQDVEGAVDEPGGEHFTGETHTATDSILEVRQNFIPELIESGDDV